jgi:peptide-methionine (S)-S-oxide reductase
MVKGESMTEKATFGGGCFWCVEAVFEQLRGVDDVISGYAGGELPNPSYEAVCSGSTGHAEVVQITFDPAVVSFKQLVEIFLTTHDPTTPNRQGADAGTQYRSIILYHSSEQKAAAEAVVADFEARNVFDSPIVTQVEPLTEFYPAEAYHQDYFRRNSLQPYCQIVIEPKLAKLRKHYIEQLKAS